jgi:flagellar basal-body rod modification protein FlgD
MSRIPSVGTNQEPGAARQAGDLRDVNLDDFLQLMITELQNQDPLSPMDNAQIVEQMSQIREISATNQLIETLDAMVTGQNLGTASALIGKQVSALTDKGEQVDGVVQRVSVETDEDNENLRTYRLHIGDKQVRMTNVREVLAESD